DMGMPVYKLFTYFIGYVPYIKGFGLTTDLGIKNNMKQYIPKFLFDFLQIIIQNSVPQFVGFLYGQMTKTLHGLFFVPRTLRSQFIHNSEQTIKGLELGFPRIHIDVFCTKIRSIGKLVSRCEY